MEVYSYWASPLAEHPHCQVSASAVAVVVQDWLQEPAVAHSLSVFDGTVAAELCL